MNAVVIDFEACSGCKTCYLACFADVIRWDAEAKRPVIERGFPYRVGGRR